MTPIGRLLAGTSNEFIVTDSNSCKICERTLALDFVTCVECSVMMCVDCSMGEDKVLCPTCWHLKEQSGEWIDQLSKNKRSQSNCSVFLCFFWCSHNYDSGVPYGLEKNFVSFECEKCKVCQFPLDVNFHTCEECHQKMCVDCSIMKEKILCPDCSSAGKFVWFHFVDRLSAFMKIINIAKPIVFKYFCSVIACRCWGKKTTSLYLWHRIWNMLHNLWISLSAWFLQVCEMWQKIMWRMLRGNRQVIVPEVFVRWWAHLIVLLNFPLRLKFHWSEIISFFL